MLSYENSIHFLQGIALGFGLYLIVYNLPAYVGELRDQLTGNMGTRRAEPVEETRRNMSWGMVFVIVLVLFARL